MTTWAEYQCPRCGWRTDVASNADVPKCRECDGELMWIGGDRLLTGWRPGEAKPCDGRPNPFYRRGEG